MSITPENRPSLSRLETKMKRESFTTQLGFILTTAGLAIGLGNLYRFPYITGQYGGAFFVLLYIACLMLIGVPLVTMELAIGRSSRKSPAKALSTLKPDVKGWKYVQHLPWIGNYVFQMFYNVVAAQMLYFAISMLCGWLSNLSIIDLQNYSSNFSQNTVVYAIMLVIVCVAGFGVCYGGLEKGVEKISVYMLSTLFIIMIGLAIYALTLPGAKEGIRFYLAPNLSNISKAGFTEVLSAAFGQSFFTLGFGAGSLCVFGSYLKKDNALAGQATKVVLLDTCVALVAGLIVFPTCFTYGIDPANGPDLILITMPAVFNAMPGGRVIGSIFFVAVIMAAFSTVISAFENIVSNTMEVTGLDRKKDVLLNVIPMILLSLPAVFGMNMWSGVQILGRGIMDFEDFLVSNNLLPIGAMIYLLFCTQKFGWGWDNFVEEANEGKGVKFPSVIKYYCKYVLPVILFVFWLTGYIN